MPTDQARFDNSHRKSCMETPHSNYKKAARNKIMKFALAIKRQFEKPSLASDCLELLRTKSLHAENIRLCRLPSKAENRTTKPQVLCLGHSQTSKFKPTPTVENLACCATVENTKFQATSRAVRSRTSATSREYRGCRVHCCRAENVKTRSNSFHSTLEPNTEVFSKVSRSLAQFTLVNSYLQKFRTTFHAKFRIYKIRASVTSEINPYKNS